MALPRDKNRVYKRRYFGAPVAADPSAWLASSAALPAGMTLTRSGNGLYLSGASYAAATYTTAGTDVARFERLASGNIGLLLEKASTNFALQSEAFDQAVWQKGELTVAANATAGLIGTTTAEALTEAAATDFHYWYQSDMNINPLATLTYSIMSKAGVRTRIAMQSRPQDVPTDNISAFADMSGAGSTDNLGAGGGAIGPTTYVQALPSAWFRFGLSGTPGDTGTQTMMQLVTVTTGTTQSYPGNTGTPAIHLQHGQLEAGAFPTSPIQTTTAAATRNADITVRDVAPPPAGFALQLQAKTAIGKSGDQVLISIDDNTTANSVVIRRSSAGNIVLDVTRSGGLVASVSGSVIADSTEFKVSASISSDSVQICVNATIGTRDTSALLPIGLSKMRFGHNQAGANHWCGHLLYGPDGQNWLGPRGDTGLINLNA